MDTTMILEIVKVAAYVVLGGLALYCQSKSKLKEKATSLITEAEEVYIDATKAGGIKHQYVVDKLYNLTPAYLKLIITKDMISNIVDNAFGSIQEYAKIQLDKVTDKAIGKTTDTDEVVGE